MDASNLKFPCKHVILCYLFWTPIYPMPGGTFDFVFEKGTIDAIVCDSAKMNSRIRSIIFQAESGFIIVAQMHYAIFRRGRFLKLVVPSFLFHMVVPISDSNSLRWALALTSQLSLSPSSLS